MSDEKPEKNPAVKEDAGKGLEPQEHSSQAPEDQDATVLTGSADPDATLLTEPDDNSDDATVLTTGGGFAETRNLLAGDSTERILKHRFVLEEMLGAGGMGEVYKARDLRKVEARDRDPYVAVKVLNEDFQRHPDAFISLQREARKSQTLAHPNIVTVYDFDRDDDAVFMTMEFLVGKPLDELLKENRQKGSPGLEPEQALSVTRGMCAALIRAHKQNIIHSDFKPGNVFVTDEGTAKVFDFGIARAVSKTDLAGGEGDGDRTVFDPGSLGALTPAYASLEMLQGKAPDPRDDIYALACVVYQLFGGGHPFDRKPADQAQAQKMRPPRLKNLTRSQWSALEKGLAFEREDRIQTVEQFLREFTRKSRMGLWLGAAALSMSLAGVLGYLVFKAPETVRVVETVVEKETVDLDSIKVQLQQERIEKLLVDDPFQGTWQDRVGEEMEEAESLMPAGNEWLQGVRDRLADMYRSQVAGLIEKQQLKAASSTLERAGNYATQESLASLAAELDAALAQQKKQQQLAQANKAAAEQERLDQIRRAKMSQADKELQAKIDNVRSKLDCSSRDLNIRHASIAIKTLQSWDPKTARQHESEFVQSLATCIGKLSASNYDQAKLAQSASLQLYPGNATLQNVELQGAP